MTVIKKNSVIPIYGTATVWCLYCLIFPLSGVLSFIILAAVGAGCYAVLSMLFPAKPDSIEVTPENQSTGDEKVDTLLADGDKSLNEMKKLRDSITDETIHTKADHLINITDQIFRKLRNEPNVYTQVKRFADFFLPTSVKLLNTYSQIDQSDSSGENIKNTMERIDSALDMTLSSYKKFYDSLYENMALDIETDIEVLETMFKKDGILEKDFIQERKET